MSVFYKWARKEHSLTRRILGTLPVGLMIIGLIPLMVVLGGRALDRLLGLSSFPVTLWNWLAAGLLVTIGLFFGFWSNLTQFDRGRGTPLPMMPTQELLITGPFRYCRNPMTFGTFLAYLGFSLVAGTYAGFGLVVCLASLLLTYIKKVEEKELTERFGEAYLAYKREVPFLIPRPAKRRQP